jgi:hypothetical protein
LPLVAQHGGGLVGQRLMACAIWIFGSARWSICALAEAVRYFHSFTNGLGMDPPAPAQLPDR